MSFSEESLELMTVNELQELGYEYIPGEKIERDYSEVLLIDRLKNSLQKLNPSLLETTIDEAIRQIKNLDLANVVKNNKKFSDYLKKGIKVAEDRNNETLYKTVKLIDSENINNNDFLVTNQFTIDEGNDKKRPDMVVFINGIPMIVFELKSMTREDVELESAYRQLKGYMDVHIPTLFYYNQILVITDGATAKAGTITADYQRFSEWKKTGIDDNVHNVGTHESLIHGIFKKETLIDLICNFIMFSDDAKILPAYHQYYGVKKAIERTLTTKDGRAGIVWHTQGSGKSFSMVFYTHNMIERLNNPTILVVTDRNDLDDQLYSTFCKCKDYLGQNPVKIADREDIGEKLNGIKAGGIFFTTLQKFEESTGLCSERKNILVIADEAHRSHYGINAVVKFDQQSMMAYKKYGTAKYLHNAFPNATYIGFTGTPVETKDHSTTNVFGDIIDVYDMTQSIEDGATVPIMYEARMAKINLNEDLLKRIDEYYAQLEDENVDPQKINESKIAMSNMKEIIEDPDRLRMIVKDILSHYEDRKNLIANKAMIVAYSRHSAYLMYKMILEERPDYENKVHMIITPNNDDPIEMQKLIGTKNDKHQLEKEFKDPNSDFIIAIVVDMWLTGFDVPELGTMYIDKPMKAHNLMQAIARVNRVYKDKKGGLIVDYIGLKKWLLEALRTYTKRDKDKIIDNTETVKLLMEKIEQVRDLFYGFDYSKFNELDNKGKYRLIVDGADFILSNEDKKKEFLSYSYDIKGLYSITTGVLDDKTKNEVLYIISVRSFINKLDGGRIDVKEINAHVAKMLEQAIQDDELIKIGTLQRSNELELLNDEILSKIQKMKTKNVAADIIKHALKGYIQRIAKTNLVMAEKFSERFKKIAEAYNQRTSLADIEQMIQDMIDLKKDIEKEAKEGNEYDLAPEEKAFFDALGNDPQVKELMKDDTLVQIAKELVEVVNKNMITDWDIKKAAKAHMRMEIRRLLNKYHYPPNKSEAAVQTVIKQAELKCKNMLDDDYQYDYETEENYQKVAETNIDYEPFKVNNGKFKTNSGRDIYYYGEEYGNMPVKNKLFKGINTLNDLFGILLKSWSKQTAYPRDAADRSFNIDNDPTFGQCTITAMLVYDMFGGSIHRIRNSSGGTHYFNKIDGHYIDLCRDQFDLYNLPVNYESNEELQREYVGTTPNTHMRFELLKENIKNNL